jgi:hypothetical protein
MSSRSTVVFYAPARRSSLAAPGYIEIATLLIVIGLYYASDVLLEGAYNMVNLVGPMMMMAALGCGILQMLQINPETIWTPLFTFRVSTLVYFGFGSIVPLIVSDEARAYLETFYAFSDEELTKLNLIVTCCVLAVLVSSSLTQSFINSYWPEGRVRRAAIDAAAALRLRNYGLAFLLIGSSIKYFVVIPTLMGWTNVEVPGAIVSLGTMSVCGIYLLTIWSLSARPIMFVVVCAVVAAEILSGLLLLEKWESLITTVAFLMAFLIQKPSYKRVMIAVAVVAFMFKVMQPLVSFARYEAQIRGSDRPSFAERLTFLKAYFESSEIEAGSLDSESALLRLSYVNAGTFAIARYDNGYPGDSFDIIFIVLVPRLLWPEKPVLNQGIAFANLAQPGQESNNVSPGFFAEAYWNFGWLGIPIVMVPFGIVLAILSKYSLTMLRRQEWILLPVLFISMRIGLSVENHFVTTVVGSLAIIVGFHCVALVLRTLFPQLFAQAAVTPNFARGQSRGMKVSV